MMSTKSRTIRATPVRSIPFSSRKPRAIALTLIMIATIGVSQTASAQAQVDVRLATIAAPDTIPIGGSTTIGVAVQNAAGQPVPGAEVMILMFNGSFEGSNLPIVKGRTDATGVYNVGWRTEAAKFYQGSGGNYEYLVQVAKLDHVRATATGTIRVTGQSGGRDRGNVVVPEPVNPPIERPIPGGGGRKLLEMLGDVLENIAPPPSETAPADNTPTPPPVPPTAVPLMVSVVASPQRVVAGESSTIQVTVRTQDGRPVEGATVTLGIGSGTFASTRGRAVTGVTTGADGTFTTLWNTANASEYSSELSFFFDVEVTKPGHIPAKTRGQLTVTPKQQRVL